MTTGVTSSTIKDTRTQDISIFHKQLLLLVFGFFYHFLIFESTTGFLGDLPFFIYYIFIFYLISTLLNVIFHIFHKARIATQIALITSVVLLPAYLYLALTNITFALFGFGVTLLQTYSVGRLIWRRNSNDLDLSLNVAEEVQTSYRRIDDLFYFVFIGSIGLCYLTLRFQILDRKNFPLEWAYISILFASTLLNLYLENIRIEAFSWKVIWKPRYLILLIPPLLILKDWSEYLYPFTHFKLIFSILVFRLCYINTLLWLKNGGFQKFWAFFINRPAFLLTTSFIIVIGIGSLLLTLPFMFKSGIHPLSFMDCLFTATSATCVTGLTTCNVADTFSFWGQMIIIAMMQIGGLGLMTISIFIAMLLRKDIGLRGLFSLGEMIGEQHCRTAQNLLKSIIFITITIEFLGATLLAASYIRFNNFDLIDAGYFGVFHAISAFCNAGFSIHPNGLIDVHPVTGLIISALIIAGGIGFSVHYALLPLFKGKRIKLNQHIKVVLSSTLLLCIGGAVLFFLFEYFKPSFSDQSLSMRCYHSWFQSVSCRTAGFNTIDLCLLQPTTLLTMILLMFIGAAPGSTAGGIKVTTFIVLITAVKSFFKGENDIILFNRRVESRSLMAAISLLLISILLVIIFVVIISLAGFSPNFIVASKDQTLKSLFLCVSAFGTVGLDLNLSSNLTIIGRIFICLLMFIGRIGPLTLLILLRSSKQKTSLSYPTDNIMIG